jgi:serine/threonine protein kinase
LFVKRLQDDHLVKIVKAYKHGEFYNFIFPCAKTNLGLYLREPHFDPFPNAGSFEEHPVWRQILGLARGLHKVLDFEEPIATGASSLFGYHFDLKPANVLVEESGSLVISDFGQATFKDVAGTTSSKIVGMGGTEAYAPPEIDGQEIKQNRRYDIWSLGCILVEVCTFVVKGSLGVLELDHIRSGKIPGTNYTDDRFFWHNFQIHSYELKPEIKQWIQRLPQFVQDGPNRNFLNDVLLLALRMLNVDVGSRLTSKEVCIRFSNILDAFQSSHHRQSKASNHAVQTLCPGVEVGKELMKRIQSISYNVAGFWESRPVRFMQEDMQLGIQTLENNIWVEKLLGPRSQLRLVPRYALRDRGTHYFSDAYLYLLSRSLKSVRGKFSAHNFADVLFLQEILLGHEVGKSVKVKAAHVVRKQQKFLPKKFQRRRSSGSNDGQSDLEVEAFSVQLWTESSHHDITDMTVPTSSSRRQSPRSLRIGPPPRRIVIFFERSIIIIYIAKNVRIKQPVQSDQGPTSLALVPTDESVDPSFAVSVFRARPEERAPSLPLTRDELNSEEMENSIECACVTLEFHNAADAESFFRTYKMVKKRWMEELKFFERLENRVGPEFGYARS